MSVSVPNILILGHSFVRRLKDDLAARFDARAAPNFHLPESGHVSLYGTGGRTVDKIHAYDLSLVLKYKPDIVILELGTNDLSTLRPEVVGSKIDDLAQVLRDQYKVRVIGVCQDVNRNIPHTRFPIAILTPKPQFCANICQLFLLTSIIYFYGSIKNFIAQIALCCP